ncbi:MAG: heavy-metal-associated domain-containing protein [Ramlibacter sp.]
MIELNLPDMTCGHCASVVAKTVSLVDPQAKVQVDLATKNVTIESGEERGEFAEALTEAGYPPKP